MTDYCFDYDRVALLMILFIPRGRVTLCLDRTEWNFGKCQVNVLMMTARCGEVAVPLFWELLDNNSGNSAVGDRVDVLEKTIDLLGLARIGLLVADREFVGAKWVKVLIDKQVPFCLRLPKTHPIRLRNGECWLAEDLLSGHTQRFYQQVLVDGQWVNVYLKQLDKHQILYLIGTFGAPELGSLYRRRWSIETLFQSLKERGFNVESSHLQSLEKLKKLLGLVAMAFGFCLVAGHHYHRKVRLIPLKGHGYKSLSYFRKGKDQLQDWLANKPIGLSAVWEAALERAYDWLRCQLTYYQSSVRIFR